MVWLKYLTQVKEALQKLVGIESRAKDQRPAFAGPVHQEITEFLRKQFLTEGGEGGLKWADLAPATKANRRRPGHGKGGIGVDTARMWTSLVGGTADSPPPEGYLVITEHSYSRGSTVPYSKWFHSGRVGQPARPIFPHPLPDSLQRKLAAILEKYIATGKKGPGVGIEIST